MKRQIRRRRPDLGTPFAFSSDARKQPYIGDLQCPIYMYRSLISQEESVNQMGQKIVALIALGTFVLVIGLGELRQAQRGRLVPVGRAIRA
jgi:hypothetical protein